MDFIPVAEESGLIVPLGRWALEKAARTIASMGSRYGGTICRSGCRSTCLPSSCCAMTFQGPSNMPSARPGIDGDRLTLELTESAFVDDPDGARRVLEALKALNTNLAMDDFGTGYSNLAYLQKLPIDVLKIDRSFVSDMLANRDNRAIVSTILSLGVRAGNENHRMRGSNAPRFPLNSRD
jgi:EAL domain-containing protein (putative c-di-GMP-specific phosphodiesterase class I)